MTRYLLDTNHVSAILKRQPVILARIKATAQVDLGVPMPVIGELWFMVFNSGRIARNTGELEGVLSAFEPWDFDERAATDFGRIKSELRRVGRPIPDVDVQIAAIARVNGLILLTADAHFEAVRGLSRENWLTPQSLPSS
jgi:tRNA(fMet)-specific endonuclease VapC